MGGCLGNYDHAAWVSAVLHLAARHVPEHNKRELPVSQRFRSSQRIWSTSDGISLWR